MILKTRTSIPPKVTNIIPISGRHLRIPSLRFALSVRTLQSLICIPSSLSPFPSSLWLVAEGRIPIDIVCNRRKVKMYVGIIRNVVIL
jgi:hypothetical protein